MDSAKYLEEFRYFLKVERSLSDNTTIAYMGDCTRFCDFLSTEYPDKEFSDITPQIIDEFLQTILVFKDRNEEEKLLKATSQTRIIQSLRAFFKFLVFNDVLQKDISKLVITPKLEQKLPVILEEEEIFAMMNAIDTSTGYGYRNWLSIEFLYATGLRVSEFINLKLDNINFKQEYLDIIGKGDKERFVPIAANVLNDLKNYIKNYRSKVNIQSQSRDYVFVSHTRGSEMTRQAINKMLNEAALKAGIKKKIHPHILRHSFATELIRNGANLVAVKEMLGHSCITATEIYINLKTDDLRHTLQYQHPFYEK